jgi:hypothetical protein
MALGQYSRRLQAVVKGKLLKDFDTVCVRQEYKEGEALREAIRLLVAKHFRNRAQKKFESRLER